jgi:hypothetical protein
MSEDDREQSLENFRKSYRNFQGVVFYVACGSTNVDQNAEYEICCYSCGQKAPWDANRFSIARRGSERDVTNAFVARTKRLSRNEELNWRNGILRELFAMFDTTIELRVIFTQTTQGGLDKLSGDELRKVSAAWDDCKTRINALLTQLIQDERQGF